MDTFVYCVTNIGSHGSLGFHPATFQWAQVEKRGSARYWWEGEGCLIPTLQWPLLTLPGAGLIGPGRRPSLFRDHPRWGVDGPHYCWWKEVQAPHMVPNDTAVSRELGPFARDDSPAFPLSLL